MIYFLSNVYKWTLTLLIVESSSAAFAIDFMQSAGLLLTDMQRKSIFPASPTVYRF